MTGAADLEQILRALRQAGTEYNMAGDELKLCEDRQQDILHELELAELKYHERARLATELSEVRKRRREVKNALEVLEPLVNWLNANPEALRSLQRVLGDMRKQEQRHANRIYIKRSDADGGILTQHPTGKK